MRNLVCIATATFALVATSYPFAAQARGGGHGSGHSRASGSSGGSHSIRGYTKKNGTYVAPNRAKNPNSTKRDNYSSKGNVNPATGKEGTRDPDKP